MWFFDGFDKFHLDVVGFLAILGEGSVLSTAQMLGASNISYIPRLIPAPQALFRAQRPSNLPTYSAQVSALESGNTKSHVHFIAHLLLDKDLEPFEVRYVTVTKSTTAKRDVGVRTSGPLLWVSILGCALSIALLATSAALHDGFANKWTMQFPKRGSKHHAPNGDLVVRYPNGSFLIVECDEDIARELYFAPEAIHYKQTTVSYQRMSLLGTTMLMVGVICLANASEILQIMWAASFVLLNAMYWMVAAISDARYWDLSAYSVEEHATNMGPASGTFAEALWKTIALCESSEWAEICTPARPITKAWKTWTEWAVEKSHEVVWEAWVPFKGYKTLWVASDKFYSIPEWDVYGKLGEASRLHESTVKHRLRRRQTPQMTPLLMPSQTLSQTVLQPPSQALSQTSSQTPPQTPPRTPPSTLPPISQPGDLSAEAQDLKITVPAIKHEPLQQNHIRPSVQANRTPNYDGDDGAYSEDQADPGANSQGETQSHNGTINNPLAPINSSNGI